MFKNAQLKAHLLSFIALLATVLLSACSGGGSDAGGSTDNSSSEMSVSILAGALSKIGNTNGMGSAASFDFPNHIATDGTNLYVTDNGNNLIRKIVIASGAVSTFAGNGNPESVDGTGTSASFFFPSGIATDGTNLYVAESGGNVIRQIVIATRVVTTLAGTPGVAGSADGTGAAAEFDMPIGLSLVGGDLYVADMWNNLIRKVVISTGVVTTFAGDGSCGSTDATGISASFCQVSGITNDGTYLYITDTGNSTVRQIDISTGVVTTLAGTAGNYGYADGTGAAAQFNYPETLTISGGYLYVMDTQSFVVRQVDISTGDVTTFAGTAYTEGYSDGVGSAIEFAGYPTGITTDGTNLYAVDSNNATIRKIVISTATSSTLAGSPVLASTGSTDGVGTAARFNWIQGIASDGTNVYVSDLINNTIRKIVVATGAVTTFAGTAGSGSTVDGTGTAARFNNPHGIVYTGGYLYVADYFGQVIRRISTTTGVVTTFAGTVGVSGYVNAVGTAAQFAYPVALATDGTYIYVAGEAAIQKIEISSATVSEVAGQSGTADYVDATGSAARFGWITALAVHAGQLYSIDDFNNIRKIDLATNAVTTIAGSTSGTAGFADGVGTAARFFYPTGLTISNSNLYVADRGNNSIRKVDLTTNEVTTLLGSMASEADSEGTLSTATLSNPNSIHFDSTLGFFIGNDANVKRVH